MLCYTVPLNAGRLILTSNGLDVGSLPVSCKRANGLLGLLRLIGVLLKSDDNDWLLVDECW